VQNEANDRTEREKEKRLGLESGETKSDEIKTSKNYEKV
jgi:hypothetical protein